MPQPPHKAGFVTIVGKPNVGKSTLMNTLIGTPLSITTPKSQTTRHKILGIYNQEDCQIVYVDTPGILKPAYKLQQCMMHTLHESMAHVDLLLWVIDVSQPSSETQPITTAIPTLILLNKVDLVDSPQLQNIMQTWEKQPHEKAIIPISALQGFNMTSLLQHILTHLPTHPPYYPKDMLTDKPQRFFAAEIVRKHLLQYYKQEIPYSAEVVITDFEEAEAIIKIHATIYVEKRSQKAILIGHQGTSLKKVGIAARKALETFLGKPVFLAQHVKVLPGWRKEQHLLRRLGYTA
ncbi:MAG: GTPase Era [Bacteroidota bacterium]